MPSASVNFKRQARAKFLLRPGVLDAAARQSILTLPFDNPIESRSSILEGIDSGKFEVIEIVMNGEVVGHSVFQILEKANGKELLSIASYASSKETTELAMPLLEQLAIDRGCKAMRAHTIRTGLIKRLIPQEWYVSEIIIRKNLSA